MRRSTAVADARHALSEMADRLDLELSRLVARLDAVCVLRDLCYQHLGPDYFDLDQAAHAVEHGTDRVAAGRWQAAMAVLTMDPMGPLEGTIQPEEDTLEVQTT